MRELRSGLIPLRRLRARMPMIGRFHARNGLGGPLAASFFKLARVLLTAGERNRHVTLLVLDKDLGFLFWLAKALEPSGHSIVPASTVSQANGLLWHLTVSVDLVLINPALEGAAAFSDAMRRGQPQLKVIALLEQGEKKSELSGVHADAMHAKPDLSAEGGLDTDGVPAEDEWGRFVEEVAGNRTASRRSNWEKLLVRGRGRHPYLH